MQQKLSTINDIDSYNSVSSALLDSHAPVISLTLVLRKHKPWYNATLRHEKRKLRRLERKRDRITDSKLRVAVQQYSTLLRTTRNSYYNNVLRDADCKAVHNIAAELMGEHTAMPRPECSDDAELATKFSSYFKDKISDIHKSLSPPKDIVHLPSVHQMADLAHITPAEVERSLKSSKIKTSALDPLPGTLVKNNIHVVSGPISRIINKSIANATVPSSLKHSVITPIYKKKQLDVNKLSSYRPIAQLPVVAKVMERHVANQLQRYMEENDIHVLHQSAYRVNHSTETALLKIHNDISRAISFHRKVDLVSLDLSAAFDILNHDILLGRLRSIGLSDRTLTWFRSYLSSRISTVRINNQYSPASACTTRVPQGSVLGPLLFTIYCLPLAEIIAKHGVHFHMYADDTQLYLDFSPEDEVSAHATIAGCVMEIKAWLSDNFLLLNENKTEAMTVMPVNQPAVAKSIQLGDVTVPLSASVTNLGAVFDKKCRMEEHATRVCRSANYYLHRIRRIRDCLNFSNTKLLVHSLVTSRLDYANGLLHNAPISVIKKLDRVQRSSARVVCRLHKYQRISMTEVLHDLHWLPVASRIKYKLLIVTFKALRTGTPGYLSDLLVKQKITKRTRSQSFDAPDRLIVPLYSGERSAGTSYSVAAPKLWNSLPVNI